MPVVPPLKDVFGGRIDLDDVADRQVAANPTPLPAVPPIQLDRWYRNGLYPDANALNLMAETSNQIATYQGRQVFCGFNELSETAGLSPAQWRWSFRTGIYHHALMVTVALMPAFGPNGLLDNYVTLTIYSDFNETTVAASVTFSRGSSPYGDNVIGLGLDWTDIRVINKLVTGLAANTEYYAKWSCFNDTDLKSACVVDLGSMTESHSGYLAMNNGCMTPVVDTFREKLATMASAMWKKGAAHVMNWTAHDTSRKTTSSTPLNIIDTSITTVSSSSPGFVLDMTNKARLSQTGVPVVMLACGRVTAPAGSVGNVYMKDSAGNTVMSLEGQWLGGQTKVWWKSTTGTLPATVDKYDFQFSTPGAVEFELYAISIYQYEA